MSFFSDWDPPIIIFKFSDNDPLKVPLFCEVVDTRWNPPDIDRILNYLYPSGKGAKRDRRCRSERGERCALKGAGPVAGVDVEL
jgi:hypothetical protein